MSAYTNENQVFYDLHQILNATQWLLRIVDADKGRSPSYPRGSIAVPPEAPFTMEMIDYSSDALVMKIQQSAKTAVHDPMDIDGPLPIAAPPAFAMNDGSLMSRDVLLAVDESVTRMRRFLEAATARKLVEGKPW